MEELTYEQLEICKAITSLCEKHLNDNIFKEERNEIFNADKWKKIADMGILSLPFDVKYEGLGADMFTTALAIQTMGRKCKDEGLIFNVVAEIAATQIPIAYFGTEEQIKKYLIPIMRGDKIGSSVITESGAGSDVSGLQTSVPREKNGFVMNGVKTFATLAPVSDILIAYGRHPDGIRMLDISAMILEKGEYIIGQIFSKIGLRTSPMSEVMIQNLHLPKERLLGRERQAVNIFMEAMVWEKMLVAAYHVGAMEQQYEEVYQYTNQRKQFKTKLINFDSIADQMIDMRMNIEASRLMLYHMCHLHDKGQLRKSHAAMLKLQTSEAKMKNSINAVAIFGGYGILQEGLIEKQMRDSLPAGIYSGTSQMQKRIIMNDLGRLYD